MTPTIPGPPARTSNIGPPESPVHARSLARPPLAAVSTRRIYQLPRVPDDVRPSLPTMVTTERPTPSVEGAAPPTIAAAGGENSSASAALMTAGIFIGAGIARRAENAKRCAGWHRSTRRVSRFGGDVRENRGHDGRG